MTEFMARPENTTVGAVLMRFADLRALVKYVKSEGRVVLVADDKREDSPVVILTEK
jgi:hypothetical protein